MRENHTCANLGDLGISFRHGHGLSVTFTGFAFFHCPVLENWARRATACLLVFVRLCKFPLASASTTVSMYSFFKVV